MAAAAQPCSDRLASFAPYSWRGNPAVPRFADEGCFIVFDGVCVLCSAFARFVARRDGAGRFRFVAAQSRLGQALMRHYGLDPVDFETNLLVTDGRACGKLEAVAGILRQLGPFWRLIAALMLILPRNGRDWLYERVAKNRYVLFGRSDACVVPDATWRDRLLTD